MSIIRKWQRSCYKRMLKAHLVTPKVVVLMDGGICSSNAPIFVGRIFYESVDVRLCMIYPFIRNGEVTWIINLLAILIC